MPHRFAKNLADLHAKGEIAAGAIRRPDVVRSLLDRLHVREPLYVSAFLILLDHQLIDLVVLNKKLEKEDVEAGKRPHAGIRVQGSVLPGAPDRPLADQESPDPLHMINPIDQQKGSATTNPYIYLTEIRLKGDEVVLHVEGIERTLGRSEFLGALRRIRKNVYRGSRLEDVNTDTPWMTEATGYPLRFIRQQMSSTR